MPHDVSLISTVAVGFALAFAGGFLASRVGLPPLVGYLLAGVAAGPFTPGFVADRGMAGQLAEIGVMLLMFGVGLHFSVADLMAVRRLAVPGAVGQIAVATAMGLGLTSLWGWSFGGGLVLALALSVASTVVLLKALEERNATTTPNGRVAVGWLIVEDLAMVLTLVLLPAFAEALGGHAAGAAHGGAEDGLLATLGVTLAKVVAFVATALLIGPRVMPWLLRQAARTGSRELFTLAVLASALGIAFGSAMLFGVSFALGAFFAGMVLNESELSHKAATSSLPLQDAFAVLFFLSVGMLFDPSILVREPLMVGGVLALVLVGKSLAALALVLGLGYPLGTALVVSASLAQIGEFSFILAGLGLTHGLLPQEGFDLILAGALLSITLNPLAFAVADRTIARVERTPALRARWEEARRPRFARLQADLDAVRAEAERKAAAHRTVTPDELPARFPMFSGLSPEQREVLVLHFRPQAAEPGERIIRAGDEADAVYFVSEGAVEVAVRGRRIRLGPGDVFGEMAFLCGERRSADVTAIDYTKLAVLSRPDFEKFLRRYPELRAHMRALAERRAADNREPATASAT